MSQTFDRSWWWWWWWWLDRKRANVSRSSAESVTLFPRLSLAEGRTGQALTSDDDVTFLIERFDWADDRSTWPAMMAPVRALLLLWISANERGRCSRRRCGFRWISFDSVVDSGVVLGHGRGAAVVSSVFFYFFISISFSLSLCRAGLRTNDGAVCISACRAKDLVVASETKRNRRRPTNSPHPTPFRDRKSTPWRRCRASMKNDGMFSLVSRSEMRKRAKVKVVL